VNESLAEVVRRSLEAWGASFHVAIPCEVERYDAATQRADLRPVVPAVIPPRDDDAEGPTLEALPVLPSVPIVWPRGGGRFLHFPLAAGDGVLVIVCDSDLSAWLRTGQANGDPGNTAAHSLPGAVGIPGLASRRQALSEGSTPRVGREGGPSVAFQDATIDAGGSNTLVRAVNLGLHLTQIAASLDALATAVGASVTYGAAGKSSLDGSAPIATTVLRGG
jgi:hypothetical protein